VAGRLQQQSDGAAVSIVDDHHDSFHHDRDHDATSGDR
jgi:hypothetical protein